MLIRVVLMPFTLDADIFWLNYVPHQLVSHGVWEPYSFAKNNFYDWVVPMRLPYHPPLSFYMTAFFQFLTQKFTPLLDSWFASYGEWLKLGGGNMIEHIASLGSPHLFRMLFVLKLPALCLDMVIGILLLHLVDNIKKAHFVYKLWMLNLPVVYVGYIAGQTDIYVLFFIVLSLFFYVKGKPLLTLFSLGLGAAAKVFPLLLIPPAILYLGKDLGQRFKLLLFAVVPLAIIFIPSFLSSGFYCFISMFPGSIGTNSATFTLKIMKIFLLSGYIFMLGNIYIMNKKNSLRFSLENYFFLFILFFFAFQPIPMRYYIWITPFLILQFTRDRDLYKFALVQLFALAALRLSSAELCFGVLAPLHYCFVSLPTPDLLLAQFLNIACFHGAMYKIFVIVTLYIFYRTWSSLSNEESLA